MQLNVSSHCRLVLGAGGNSGAIYDLVNGTVFSLNRDGLSAVKKSLSGEEVTPDEQAFLADLAGRKLLGCGEFPALAQDYPVKPRLRYAWLELTNRCNCRCLHCYGAFGEPQADPENELSFSQWAGIITALREKGCSAIQLIGGEPLLSPDFLHILAFAHESGMSTIDIFTNGFFLDRRIALAIQDANASVRVSLYGYDAQTHDGITQRAGSFSKLDEALDLLREMGIRTRIAVVLMRENQDYLPRIVDYIVEKGHQYTGFDAIRGVNHPAKRSHRVTNEEILIQRYMAKPSFSTSYYDYSLSRQWNDCWFGKLAVTATGDVLPCIFARELSCGNVRSTPVVKIRESLIACWQITKDSVDGCSRCEYRYCCTDCRPLAMGDGDGLLGKYPRCLYEPDAGTWNGERGQSAAPNETDSSGIAVDA